MAWRLLLLVVLCQQCFNTNGWLFQGKCFREMYPDFQCYSLRYPYWNTLLHYPRSPSSQKIRFKLYTPLTPHSPKMLHPTDARRNVNASISPHDKVAVVIHGFTDSSTLPWALNMIRELLTMVPNVIAVDWKRGSKGPNYLRAAANSRVVGAQLATLIKTLGVDPGKVHLIGHSLGAHVAGYAGEKFGKPGFVQQKIGRITGLDPAALAFEKFNVRVKLDRSDATFVDVIHTDAPFRGAGAGVGERTGHVDFYPNGGSRMPGCNAKVVSLIKVKDVKSNLACSHNRALHYFTASIRHNDFKAHSCWNRLLWRFCRQCGNGGCNNMGYHATPRPEGVFVLHTDSHFPY